MISYKDLVKTKEITSAANFLGRDKKGMRISVGMATCGLAAGAKPIYEYLKDKTKDMDDIFITPTGCLGTCILEPMMDVIAADGTRTTYVLLNAKKAEKIYTQHLLGGNPVKEFTVGAAQDTDAINMDEVDYFKAQTRIILQNCGLIDPESIDEYIAVDGYRALHKVVTELNENDVVDILLSSGLRGRGGAGFPTGLKWKYTMGEADQKYVICNADEGDPGAFMNRSVLEGDPHAILEAMAICGYTIGADTGYIYCRAEYPVAVERLNIAIDQAREKGLLGKNIFDSGFNFDIQMRLGAGAFVCGEETALIASIEGQRGEPTTKPPFPSVMGVFKKPTVINNVGTFANVPRIINNGADWFSSIGTENSKGTKVFALGGKINNTGLVEVPMGTTLRQIIFDIGGGIPDGKKFKAAQIGGPSGGCIPEKHLDTPIDYDSLQAIGAMMGSGGLIVLDEDNCMVDIARFFLDFTVDESCGKCIPCRIGTKRMLEILERIVIGQGKPEDIKKLQTLASGISSSSLCGLGQTSPNPILSTMRYFMDEYIVHINEKRCPASYCKKLIKYTILPDKCVGCELCARKCPTVAITGIRKTPYVIDQTKCIKCDACYEACRFDAIVKK